MKKKYTAAEKHARIQQILERYRRFDYDYIPFGKKRKTPDGTHKYRANLFQRICAFFVRLFTATAGVLLIKIWFGCRVVGKKNLKAVKGMGAFCVTNHFSNLDILPIRYGTGYFRSYVTVAPWNNKTGVLGWLMRRAGILPLSPNLAATRNLWKEMGRLLDEKKLICFYAEQAMWIAYQKPRPMKEGAFFFAVKYNVPVVPVFVTWKRTKRGFMRKMCVHVLPAIFPDGELGKTERAKKMQEQAELAWKECYEQTYGIPLVYEDREDVSKQAIVERLPE